MKYRRITHDRSPLPPPSFAQMLLAVCMTFGLIDRKFGDSLLQRGRNGRFSPLPLTISRALNKIFLSTVVNIKLRELACMFMLEIDLSIFL